ncbi:hypothetical protein HKD37_04G010305 [Glycine soja]
MDQLVPTIEKFEGILGCPLGGRKPYLFSGFYPSMARTSKVVKISAQELDRVKQYKNGVVGIPRKRLEEKAEALVDQGKWTSFIDILALLVFGTILFPNVNGLVDLDAINAFLAYHHRKESLTIVVLVDAYDTFNLRCKKRNRASAKRNTLGLSARKILEEDELYRFAKRTTSSH